MSAEEPKSIPNEENTLLVWESPSRPFQKRSREFYRTAGALVFLVSMILVFIGEFLLIGVILATFFVIYTLSTVEPEKIKHKVTNLGVETAGHFHKWEEMYEFWFDEKAGQKLVVVRMLLGFPSHLQLLLDEMTEDKIKRIFSEKIPYREKPEQTFLDRASSWMVKKIPLERPA